MKNKKKTQLRPVRNILLAALVVTGIVMMIAHLSGNKRVHKMNIVGFNGPVEWLGKSYVKNLEFKVPAYYQDFVASKAPQKVRPEYSPVIILTYLNGELEWLGTGSVRHFANDTNEYVFTAGHLFDSDTVGTNIFLYLDLYDPEGRCWGIDHIKQSSEISGIKLTADDPREVDIAVCRKGPITLIPGYSKAFKSKSQKEYGKFANLTEDIKLTSLVSGRTYNAIGWFKEFKDQTGQGVPIPYLTFDYLSRSGESGTGFISSDNALYVLLGSTSDQSAQNKWTRKPSIGVSRATRIEFH
jgi:hypothetical protein